MSCQNPVTRGDEVVEDIVSRRPVEHKRLMATGWHGMAQRGCGRERWSGSFADDAFWHMRLLGGRLRTLRRGSEGSRWLRTMPSLARVLGVLPNCSDKALFSEHGSGPHPCAKTAQVSRVAVVRS